MYLRDLQVARLDAAFGGVHPHLAADVVEPHRRDLRRAVGLHRGDVGERLLRRLQQVEVLLGDGGHFGLTPVSGGFRIM
jgi:hypothetical protein